MLKSISLFFMLCIALDVSMAYTTSGAQILDQNGNPVTLRGIWRPSLEWSCSGQYMSLEDYTLMQSWGANIIRLSLSQCCLVSGLNGYTSDYLTTIEQQVTWIKSLGMGVILDLHWSNQGNPATKCAQQPSPDTYSITFWQIVAAQFANDPMIIFELYNEPFLTDWNVWKNGGNTAGVTAEYDIPIPPYTAVGIQQLYNTVRAAGANNAVMIAGNNWGFDLSGLPSHPIQGINIIYDTHPYNYPGKQPSDWQTNFGFLVGEYPMMSGEFGDTQSPNCTLAFYLELMDFVTAHNMSWIAGGWWVQDCLFPSMISDWNGTPTAMGELMQQYLKSGQTSQKSAQKSSPSDSARSASLDVGQISSEPADPLACFGPISSASTLRPLWAFW